jgi:hypothetical protein
MKSQMIDFTFGAKCGDLGAIAPAGASGPAVGDSSPSNFSSASNPASASIPIPPPAAARS